MWIAFSAAILVTIGCLWYRSSRVGEASGRGWFLRNLGGALNGFLFGALQVWLFSHGSWIWLAGGFLISLVAIGVARSEIPIGKN